MALLHILVLHMVNVTAAVAHNAVPLGLKIAGILAMAWGVPAVGNVGILVLVLSCSNAVIGKSVSRPTLQIQAVSGKDVFALNPSGPSHPVTR